MSPGTSLIQANSESIFAPLCIVTHFLQGFALAYAMSDTCFTFLGTLDSTKRTENMPRKGLSSSSDHVRRLQ